MLDVPSKKNVMSAVTNLEHLYASCLGGSGNLSDGITNFVKEELTVGDMLKIVKKKEADSKDKIVSHSTFSVDEIVKKVVQEMLRKEKEEKEANKVLFNPPDPSEFVVAIPEDDWEEQKARNRERRKKKKNGFIPLIGIF